MDNQHRQIAGYRELEQDEIDLINRIKVKGEELRQLLDECRAVDVLKGKTGNRENDDVLDEASRWRALARTHLQQGLMALVRSVAKPGFF